jgi:hypothetical protein
LDSFFFRNRKKAKACVRGSMNRITKLQGKSTRPGVYKCKDCRKPFSVDEYVRLGGFVHVNTAESFHAIIKRQMYGTHHAVSEQHLQRYINEIAFKWYVNRILPILPHEPLQRTKKGAQDKEEEEGARGEVTFIGLYYI